jgi:molybdate transport system substrate-binding protein
VRIRIGVLALAAVLAAAGCDSAGGSSSKPRLTVSAAASMTEALDSCAPKFADARVRPSFAGSDELAAQIRQGVKPDVFASANTKLPEALNAEGRLSKPVEFATNELVLAVPADSKVRSLDDVSQASVKLAVGSASVPVGSYTREVLGHLPAAERKAILANVRSDEPDVKGVVGKLTQGAADAGFAYASDVKATDGKLRAIELPDRLKPTVTYAAGVVNEAGQPAAGKRFVEDLRSGRCAAALERAGFGPPPR